MISSALAALYQALSTCGAVSGPWSAQISSAWKKFRDLNVLILLETPITETAQIGGLNILCSFSHLVLLLNVTRTKDV